MVVTGQATLGSAAQQLIAQRVPDLLLTELILPDMSGLDLAQWLSTQPYTTRVVMLNPIPRQVLQDSIIPSLIHAAVSLNDGLDELTLCIHTVLADMMPAHSNKDPQRQPHSSTHLTTTTNAASFEALTYAEMRILRYISHHISIKEMATRLSICACTVNNHLYRIRKKLHLTGHGAIHKYLLTPEGQTLLALCEKMIDNG